MRPKARKPGRPRLPKGQAKGKIMPVRFTHSEAAAFARTAKAKGQTLSEWVRSTLTAAIAS
jgi:predicted HicB family RNase H-like nuclease